MGTARRGERHSLQPPAPARQAGGKGALGDVLEREILPRLLVAHGSATGEAAARLAMAESRSAPVLDVAVLAALALDMTTEAFEGQLNAMLGAGVAVEAILESALAPVARRLGELWERDVITFVDVTIALGRLQKSAHDLRWRSPARSPRIALARSILVAAVPGESHAFGASIVAMVFERAGWRVCLESGATEPELAGLVSCAAFDLVALSASCTSTVERLPALIQKLRQAAAARRIMVMVGGGPFAEAPELALQVGADGTGADAASALATAEKLLDLATRID